MSLATTLAAMALTVAPHMSPRPVDTEKSPPPCLPCTSPAGGIVTTGGRSRYGQLGGLRCLCASQGTRWSGSSTSRPSPSRRSSRVTIDDGPRRWSRLTVPRLSSPPPCGEAGSQRQPGHGQAVRAGVPRLPATGACRRRTRDLRRRGPPPAIRASCSSPPRNGSTAPAPRTTPTPCTHRCRTPKVADKLVDVARRISDTPVQGSPVRVAVRPISRCP